MRMCHSREVSMCPYLVPVVADRLWQVSQGAYCRRPDAGVRVPGRKTLLEVCTTDRFGDCDGFRKTVGLAGPPPQRG